jgi:hypothetical protein
MSDEVDMSETRRLSHELFGGAQYRIEVGAAIAESDGTVCMADLVKQLGDPPGKSSVNAELKVLERAGLLTRPAERHERRIELVREESPYWEMCSAVCKDTAVGRSPQRRSSLVAATRK